LNEDLAREYQAIIAYVVYSRALAGAQRSMVVIVTSSPLRSAQHFLSLVFQDLEKITDLTLSHYNELAEEFWEDTRDHNVHQNIAALLQCIEGEPPFTILDFGCGPGRDLKAFAELGHIAVGLEGAAHFAVMARAHSGCEVWQQDFLKLDLPG
jgi:SAM-dependent methyltransferase